MKKFPRSFAAMALVAVSLSACSGPASDQPEQADQTNAAAPKAPAQAGAQEQAGASGKVAFTQCAACHAMEAGAGNKVGPNLAGVIGRKAGAVEGFAYSPAMASSGLTWSREELDRFLKHPMQVVPGTKMAFAGIADDARRAALIDYLAASAATEATR